MDGAVQKKRRWILEFKRNQNLNERNERPSHKMHIKWF